MCEMRRVPCALTLYAAASMGRRLAVSRREWEGGGGGGEGGRIEDEMAAMGDGGGGKNDEEREKRDEAKGEAWGGTWWNSFERGVAKPLFAAADDAAREGSAIADDVSHECLRRSNTSHVLECWGGGGGCRKAWLRVGDERETAAAAGVAAAPGAKSKLQKHSM
jgi:hypothetical protein